MASIRERKGKFNVIYNYKDDSGKRKQKWETWSDEETDVLSLEQSCVGFSFEEAQEPVSYTHLDVYKRQQYLFLWILTASLMPKRGYGET